MDVVLPSASTPGLEVLNTFGVQGRSGQPREPDMKGTEWENAAGKTAESSGAGQTRARPSATAGPWHPVSREGAR